MTPEIWSRIINELKINSHPEELGFEPDGMGAEKHGSWVWHCLRNDRDMTRITEFALTQVSSPDRLSGNLVEIFTGGDNGSRFERFPAANFSYPFISNLMEGIPSVIAPAFVEAMQRAMNLKEENLSKSRP